MITKLKFLCIILFSIGFISACQNENFDEISKSNRKNISTIDIDNQMFAVNPVNVELFVENPNDIDDEKINRQLLEIAIAAREYFRNNSQNEIIMNKSKFSSNKCFNLNELSSIISLKSASKEYLNFISAINKADLKHKSNNPLKSGVVEKYVPAIHFVNLETADINKRPFICPGFEVNIEMTGLEEFENYIVAWFYDDEDKLNEILINEDMAMATTHPVLVIDNAEEASMDIEQMNYDNSATLKSTMTVTEYHSCEFKINLGYEDSGDSEFCITGAQINENGTVQLILKDNGAFTAWKEISSVSSRNIGRLFSEWNQFCSNDVFPLDNNFIFWNTYERDWYSSDKTLGQASRNNATIYLSGNRKYSNEWYMYDPVNLNSNPLDLNTIYNSWAKWHTNSKTEFRIWRVEL
jgi:hypothetical protein